MRMAVPLESVEHIEFGSAELLDPSFFALQRNLLAACTSLKSIRAPRAASEVKEIADKMGIAFTNL